MRNLALKRLFLGAFLGLFFRTPWVYGAPVYQPSEPPIIQAVAWRDFGLCVRANAPLTPRLSELTAPPRFIIDFPGAELADTGLAQTLQVHRANISQVRLYQNTAGVRMVIDCLAAIPFQVVQLDGGALVAIEPSNQVNDALKALLVERQTVKSDSQTLESIQAQELGDAFNLHIQSAKGLKCALFQADATHLEIRMPACRGIAALPQPTGLVTHLEGTSAPDGSWILHVTLHDQNWALQDVWSPDRTGLSLRFAPVNPQRFVGRPLVIVDPGHGGNDPGAVGPDGIQEKDVCLALGHALQKALWQRHINAELTRSADSELYLAPRVNRINEAHAALFISLHANSHTTPDVQGLETYWREPVSLRFAQILQQTLITKLKRVDRGVKQERLYVLRHLQVPSVLVETGFISNPTEEKLLANPDFQRLEATSIAAGIENYLALSPLACR